MDNNPLMSEYSISAYCVRLQKYKHPHLHTELDVDEEFLSKLNSVELNIKKENLPK